MPAASGERIGNIRLDATLGEGGMGTVWAGYDEKLRREVAVKAIRADRVDLETRARLLAEARILSRLEHPDVCRLYDYVEGTDGDYLVLERIRGRTLAAAIRDGLSKTEKLRIAERIARALAAAHARGIVHRDLKPSNVMLEEDGGLKVLDFGLARALDAPEPTPRAAPRPARSPPAGPAQEGPAQAGPPPAGAPQAMVPSPAGPPQADGTLTRLGSVVLRGEAGRVTGTPANMSPEQARGERATPASDLYSFGLLLQELFTGRPAYPPGLDPETLLVKAADGDTLPVAGVDRELRALVEALKTRDPEARPTASETAARLRRIRDRPRRRRRRLLAAAITAAFVAGGVKYALDLRRERDRAVEARREAEQATAFLTDLFAAADPWEKTEGELTVRQVLDRGRERIAGELDAEPRVRGRLLMTLGKVYDSLAQYEPARELFEAALEVNRTGFGAGSIEVAENLYKIGVLHHRQGRLDDAESHYRRALEIYEAAPDPPPVATAKVLTDLANVYAQRGEDERPEALYRRALARMEARLGPDDPQVTSVLSEMATHHLMRGEDLLAEPILRRTLAIRERQPELPGLADTLGVLALLYTRRGELARAEPLFERALAIGERTRGPEHPLVTNTRHNHAVLLLSAGELARAATLFERVLVAESEIYGADHHLVALTRHNLARVFRRQGRYAEAERVLRRALAAWGEAVGADHPRAAEMLLTLAAVRRARGAPEEAETLLDRAAGIFEETLGEDSPFLTDARLDLAALALERGETGRAAERYDQALGSARDRLAENPENVLDRGRLAAAHFGLGRVAARRGAHDEAAARWRETLEILDPPAADRAPAELIQTRALALLLLGRVEDARPLIERLLAGGWSDEELLEQARDAGLARARDQSVSRPRPVAARGDSVRG